MRQAGEEQSTCCPPYELARLGEALGGDGELGAQALELRLQRAHLRLDAHVLLADEQLRLLLPRAQVLVLRIRVRASAIAHHYGHVRIQDGYLIRELRVPASKQLIFPLQSAQLLLVVLMLMLHEYTSGRRALNTPH